MSTCWAPVWFMNNGKHRTSKDLYAGPLMAGHKVRVRCDLESDKFSFRHFDGLTWAEWITPDFEVKDKHLGFHFAGSLTDNGMTFKVTDYQRMN